MKKTTLFLILGIGCFSLAASFLSIPAIPHVTSPFHDFKLFLESHFHTSHRAIKKVSERWEFLDIAYRSQRAIAISS
jgi:hypothetical protein